MEILKIVKLKGDDDAVGLVYENKERKGGNQALTFKKNGRFMQEQYSDLDIVSEWEPYYEWPIDAEVYVWDTNKAGAVPRYFAGVSENGKAMTFLYGATSFSADENQSLVVWRHAMLREDYEREMKS